MNQLDASEVCSTRRGDCHVLIFRWLALSGHARLMPNESAPEPNLPSANHLPRQGAGQFLKSPGRASRRPACPVAQSHCSRCLPAQRVKWAFPCRAAGAFCLLLPGCPVVHSPGCLLGWLPLLAAHARRSLDGGTRICKRVLLAGPAKRTVG